MANYWVYIDDKVVGPYSVDKLIKLRGFSRQTLVCVDDHSGKPGDWIAVTDIPELAAIFRAADQYHEIPVVPKASKPPTPKPQLPKMPTPRPVRVTETPAPVVAKRRSWAAVVVSLLVLSAAGAGAYWWKANEKKQWKKEKLAARKLVMDLRLPQRTFAHYLKAKEANERWEYEKTSAGLINTTVSWFGNGTNAGVSNVLGFEVNLDAQSVRPMNSAAARLMAEGSSAPEKPAESHKPAPAPKPKPSTERFTDSLKARGQAVESGDFDAVWDAFSHRKRSNMIKAGISQSGFVRLQKLTRGLEAGVKLSVLKTAKEEDGSMLVLLRQSQANRTDLFLKQHWVLEDNEWKLDEEDKRSADPGPESAREDSPTPPATAPKTNIPVMKLPGLSN